MAKVLVASDLHLSDKIWKHRPIEMDSYFSWKQIVEIAIEENCSSVVLAGDILDKQTNNSEPVYQLLSGLERLNSAGISVYYNQGQHEFQKTPWMSLNSKANHFNGHFSCLLIDMRWTGIDYCQPDDLQKFLSSPLVKHSDVLVCHQVWLEFMGEECKPQGSFYDIPKNVKYLITGDYHMTVCKKFGDLIVISPGSTHFRSIAEPENKHVFVLESNSVSTRELFTRRKIEIDSTSRPRDEVFEEISQKLIIAQEYAEEVELPVELQAPLIRFTYDHSDSSVVDSVEKLVDGRAHLFYKQIKNTVDSSEPSLSEHMDANDRVTLLSSLDNYVDKETDPEVYSLAHKLLEYKDPDQVLDQWIKESK